VLGFSQLFSGGIRLELTAYDKKMSRLGTRYENLFDPYAFFPEAAGDRVAITPSVARSRGLEVALTGVSARRVDWRVAYGWSSASDRIDGRYVPRAWDEPHRLSWGVGFAPAERWRMAMRGMYHTGRPTTPVTGSLQLAPDGSATVVPVVGALHSARLPAYSRLDVDFARTFALRDGELRLWGGVANVLNRANVCCTEVSFGEAPDGSVTTTLREYGGLSRHFTWGISWTF
jgi:hypothetical protein